jgi:hypothetical protein
MPTQRRPGNITGKAAITYPALCNSRLLLLLLHALLCHMCDCLQVCPRQATYGLTSIYKDAGLAFEPWASCKQA